MRRMRIVLALVLFAVGVLAALIPAAAHAATGLSGSTVTVGPAQTINDDLYVAGSSVTIDGRINGNLIAAGGTVIMDGVVTGSLIQVGGTTTIGGTVNGSVLAAGGTMTVDGRVRHDVVYFGGTLTIGSGATVGRDLENAGGSLTIAGHVARNVRTSSGSVHLNSGAVIGGSLTYSGSTKPQIASGATVHGPVVHQSGNVFWGNVQAPWSTGLSIVAWLRSLIGLLAFGLLVVFLAPMVGRRGVETLQQHPFSSLGWGALTLIAVPIVAALTFILGLIIGGWWLSLIALAVYALGLLLGCTITALFLGRLITQRASPAWQAQWLSLLVGVVILQLVSIIPVLGGLVMALAAVWGLGALVTITVPLFPLGRAVGSGPAVTPTYTQKAG